MGSPPIYLESDQAYHIDTCKPQIRAIREGKIKFFALSGGYYPGRHIPPVWLPGVPSIGFWDAAGEQDWGLEDHRNEGIEITFLETGHMPFCVEGREFSLEPGHMTVTRPWHLHRLGNPNIGPGRIFWLILDVGVRRPNQAWSWPDWIILTPLDLARLTRTLRETDQVVWLAHPPLRACFQRLAHAIREETAGQRISLIRTTINELFLHILELLGRCDRPPNPMLSSNLHTVSLFLRDLKDNPSSLAHLWTLEEMAAQCGLKKSAMIHYCRRICNMTPLDYLNRCRIDHSLLLLRQSPGRSITEIAFECGFQSSQYFATVFRRQVGCAPREYRQR